MYLLNIAFILHETNLHIHCHASYTWLIIFSKINQLSLDFLNQENWVIWLQQSFQSQSKNRKYHFIFWIKSSKKKTAKFHLGNEFLLVPWKIIKYNNFQIVFHFLIKRNKFDLWTYEHGKVCVKKTKTKQFLNRFRNNLSPISKVILVWRKPYYINYIII